MKKRRACRELGLPTTGSKKDLDKRIKDRMQRNHTSPTEFTLRATLTSDFKCDSLSENEIGKKARKAIENVADEATIDYSQEPVRWGNRQELTVLEDQNKSLQDVNKQHLARIATLEVDLMALKATTEAYFAVRSRFFRVFLQDRFGKTTSAEQKLINEGNFAAHGGDPLTDARMFKQKIRTDDTTFELLYGM